MSSATPQDKLSTAYSVRERLNSGPAALGPVSPGRRRCLINSRTLKAMRCSESLMSRYHRCCGGSLPRCALGYRACRISLSKCTINSRARPCRGPASCFDRARWRNVAQVRVGPRRALL